MGKQIDYKNYYFTDFHNFWVWFILQMKIANLLFYELNGIFNVQSILFFLSPSVLVGADLFLAQEL